MATSRKKTAAAGTRPRKRTGQVAATGATKRPEHPLMAALRAEHRHMGDILELFREQLDTIERGGLVDTHVVYEIMDYMVTWPDRYHHPREDLVYSRVAEIDAAAADSVDSLQREHDAMAAEARVVLKTIEAWRGGRADGGEVIRVGRDYMERLRHHMRSEEKLVFPQIEALLTAGDWRQLAAEDLLRPVRDPLFGGRVDREFRNVARKLRRGVRNRLDQGFLAEWAAMNAVVEAAVVVNMALESCVGTTADHLRAALTDSRGYLRERPLTGAVLSAANNARLTFSLLGDMAGISRDALEDLARINQERRDRIRIMGRKSNQPG